MFGAATPSGQGSIGVAAGDIVPLLNAIQGAYSAIPGTTGVLTAPQIAGGLVVSSGGSTPTLTTDTATNIINALTQTPGAVPRIGQSFQLELVNLNSGTATVAGGTGVTIVGTATIATATARYFLGTIVGTTQSGGAPAISLQSMYASPATA